MNLKKVKKIIQNIICFFLIIISSSLLSLSHYLKSYFNSTYFEQLLYNLLNTTTFNLESLYSSVASVVLWMVILVAIFSIPILIHLFFGIDKIKIRKKIINFSFKKYSILIFLISILIISIQTKIPNYIKNTLSTSQLYEEYYVPYEKEKIIFPEKKQNLITIYVESFEASNFSIENGGTEKESYAPKLEDLAKKYINFSNTDTLGGFKRVNGTDWTIAGLVAQTAGIPLYITTKNKENNFLEGATSLGDILQEFGYKNYFMIGSDASFGERKKYFTEHGDYDIYDYYYAINNRKIQYNYYTWWGYEDQKLYKFAKEKLLTISKEEEPFNFTMLTADTHFFDGYLDSNCPKVFSSQYANSFYCADMMIADFIDWIQQQDFYSNTTIIIVGDHLTMRENFYKTDKNYERTVFNLIINSRVNTENTKNRDFTAFDMFPTSLASLGVEIEGNRLALGTNLFSDKLTLSEELGYSKFQEDVQKKSVYYQKEILK